MKKLFVYGTLRQHSQAYPLFLKKFVIGSEPGMVLGELYRVKDEAYPALIEGNRKIVGEVMRLKDEFDYRYMDEYEQYYGVNHPDNLYNRVHIPLYPSNELVEVYLYNMNRIGALQQLGKLIKSNDYLKR